MIQIEDFRKRYDERLAVDGVSFFLGAGEIVGLVGPNGAGKTTTMRAIAGVLPPTEGKIFVGGVSLREDPIGAKKQIALIPDEPHLFPGLTVWEHLEFTAQVYGVKEFSHRGEGLLAELELLKERDTISEELSRGMRQKVAVACAFLHDPKALLLDEPLTGLDPRGIRTLYGMLRRAAAGGAAVLLSSHLLGQIEELCTKFLILRGGKLLFQGSKAEIQNQLQLLQGDASLEEIFFQATEGGAPPANS